MALHDIFNCGYQIEVTTGFDLTVVLCFSPVKTDNKRFLKVLVVHRTLQFISMCMKNIASNAFEVPHRVP
jgi:hypothetical protein